MVVQILGCLIEFIDNFMSLPVEKKKDSGFSRMMNYYRMLSMLYT